MRPTEDRSGGARRFAITTIKLLISQIGGWTIPSFTRNWLAKRKAETLPTAFGRFDQVTLGVTAFTLVWWALAPYSAITGMFTALAALLNILKFARRRGVATLSEPLVWILHLGYLWIPIGFDLIVASIVLEAIPQTGAIHALTVGAMGTMITTAMSRATLGHTGQPLIAGSGLTATYVLITLASLMQFC